ncbi:latent-transforming growth factor beta-binding protein 3 isoform X5 [Pristis pectinata]|uniref:latent-transforming growth factor beta-binding protein 3 isoform X5 n=1 Tax=Pristis pectinata TaxID=685728 RepID=UPI00223CA47F|nr:latent-transforming growth factor beta-binding protein 3 isoform X5 [Pristis pectinata]
MDYKALSLLVCLGFLWLPAASTQGKEPSQGRFKVVFTPTICKRTCMKGHCQDSCKRGNTTTLISENGHAADTLTGSGFRVVVCPLPCMNGGQCSSRNRCQCPTHFTGKFCQISVSGKVHPHQPTPAEQPTDKASETYKHSVFTLQLTPDEHSPAKFIPGIPFSGGQHHRSEVQLQPVINLHVRHPPEATVQIHRVSSIDSYLSEQKILQPVQKVNHQPPRTLPTQKKLGRCFQETLPKTCSNPLPGLTKEEDCCGSVGASWGFSNCNKCRHQHYLSDPKTGFGGGMECPQGYKRLNATHCQDINECLMQGVCQNAECLNTQGSFRCACKPGYVMGPSRTHCVVTEQSGEKGPCYLLVDSEKRCAYALGGELTKQICCCSVGKAWGTNCDPCPISGTAEFHETCPAGMGYHFSSSHQKISIPPGSSITVRIDPDGKARIVQVPITGPTAIPQEQIDKDILEATTIALVPTFSLTEKVFSASFIPFGSRFPVELEARPTTPAVKLLPPEQSMEFGPSKVIEMDTCKVDRGICGHGVCVYDPAGYTCACHTGYQLHPHFKQCVDVNECDNNPCGARKGKCVNSIGTYTCLCYRGYQLQELPEGSTCVDINECSEGLLCTNGRCVNTEGSFFCHCHTGYRLVSHQTACEDINECLNPSTCPRGKCKNKPGTYECVPCPEGYRSQAGECFDINECNEGRLCANGRCLNTEGSFQCRCHPGYRLSSQQTSCEDINECLELAHACLNGECVNTPGSYTCQCQPGYQLVDGTKCKDINECALNRSLCGPNGTCKNVEGSYTCVCDTGFILSPDGSTCEEPERPEGKKECYLSLDDPIFCDSVLATNITKEECCCSLGAGWGDLCEIYPCPVHSTAEFHSLCPDGKGYLVNNDNLFSVGLPTYRDIDECTLFGQEICKEGFCMNTQPGFECYCKQGYYYDGSLLQCLDVDECQDIQSCPNARCINTKGSFTCACLPPMTFDTVKRRCVQPMVLNDRPEMERDLCWKHVNNDFTCSHPILGYHTTFSECCCQHGQAWGLDCHICPPRMSANFPHLCNATRWVPLRPGRRADRSRREQINTSQSSDDNSSYDDSDECSCRHGRCVRGRRCDCYKGFQLDSSGKCRDINECRERHHKGSLCKNARCVNTLGSYRCVCFQGFVPERRHGRCIRWKMS